MSCLMNPCASGREPPDSVRLSTPSRPLQAGEQELTPMRRCFPSRLEEALELEGKAIPHRKGRLAIAQQVEAGFLRKPRGVGPVGLAIAAVAEIQHQQVAARPQ